MTPNLQLEARQLAAVRGNASLFRDVSFRIDTGQVLVVQGPNGAGKTTLLRILAGLGSIVDGAVQWCGEAMAPLDARLRAAAVFVGHAPAVKDDLTAAENLVAMLSLAGDPADAGTVEAALTDAGLAARAALPARWLSQGQRRRLSLARLACTRRPLWILDEPATALDDAAAAWLGKLIGTHARGGGLVVAATHQALRLPAARVATLTLG